MHILTAKAHEILLRLLAEKGPHAKWDSARFNRVKSIANTGIGQVGESFAVELLRAAGHDARKNPSPRGEWDIQAAGKTMEVKCASEDVNGVFQFNGVRYDTQYDFLLVVGISPDDIWFRFYKRNQLTDLKLAAMAKKVAGSYKLTRKKSDMLAIGEFVGEARKFLGAPSNPSASV